MKKYAKRTWKRRLLSFSLAAVLSLSSVTSAFGSESVVVDAVTESDSGGDSGIEIESSTKQAFLSAMNGGMSAKVYAEDGFDASTTCEVLTLNDVEVSDKDFETTIKRAMRDVIPSNQTCVNLMFYQFVLSDGSQPCKYEVTISDANLAKAIAEKSQSVSVISYDAKNLSHLNSGDVSLLVNADVVASGDTVTLSFDSKETAFGFVVTSEDSILVDDTTNTKKLQENTSDDGIEMDSETENSDIVIEEPDVTSEEQMDEGSVTVDTQTAEMQDAAENGIAVQEEGSSYEKNTDATTSYSLYFDNADTKVENDAHLWGSLSRDTEFPEGLSVNVKIADEETAAKWGWNCTLYELKREGKEVDQILYPIYFEITDSDGNNVSNLGELTVTLHTDNVYPETDKYRLFYNNNTNSTNNYFDAAEMEFTTKLPDDTASKEVSFVIPNGCCHFEYLFVTTMAYRTRYKYIPELEVVDKSGNPVSDLSVIIDKQPDIKMTYIDGVYQEEKNRGNGFDSYDGGIIDYQLSGDTVSFSIQDSDGFTSFSEMNSYVVGSIDETYLTSDDNSYATVGYPIYLDKLIKKYKLTAIVYSSLKFESDNNDFKNLNWSLYYDKNCENPVMDKDGTLVTGQVGVENDLKFESGSYYAKFENIEDDQYVSIMKIKCLRGQNVCTVDLNEKTLSDLSVIVRNSFTKEIISGHDVKIQEWNEETQAFSDDFACTLIDNQDGSYKLSDTDSLPYTKKNVGKYRILDVTTNHFLDFVLNGITHKYILEEADMGGSLISVLKLNKSQIHDGIISLYTKKKDNCKASSDSEKVDKNNVISNLDDVYMLSFDDFELDVSKVVNNAIYTLSVPDVFVPVSTSDYKYDDWTMLFQYNKAAGKGRFVKNADDTYEFQIYFYNIDDSLIDSKFSFDVPVKILSDGLISDKKEQSYEVSFFDDKTLTLHFSKKIDDNVFITHVLKATNRSHDYEVDSLGDRPDGNYVTESVKVDNKYGKRLSGTITETLHSHDSSSGVVHYIYSTNDTNNFAPKVFVGTNETNAKELRSTSGSGPVYGGSDYYEFQYWDSWYSEVRIRVNGERRNNGCLNRDFIVNSVDITFTNITHPYIKIDLFGITYNCGSVVTNTDVNLITNTVSTNVSNTDIGTNRRSLHPFDVKIDNMTAPSSSNYVGFYDVSQEITNDASSILEYKGYSTEGDNYSDNYYLKQSTYFEAGVNSSPTTIDMEVRLNNHLLTGGTSYYSSYHRCSPVTALQDFDNVLYEAVEKYFYNNGYSSVSNIYVMQYLIDSQCKNPKSVFVLFDMNEVGNNHSTGLNNPLKDNKEKALPMHIWIVGAGAGDTISVKYRKYQFENGLNMKSTKMKGVGSQIKYDTSHPDVDSITYSDMVQENTISKTIYNTCNISSSNVQDVLSKNNLRMSYYLTDSGDIAYILKYDVAGLNYSYRSNWRDWYRNNQHINYQNTYLDRLQGLIASDIPFRFNNTSDAWFISGGTPILGDNVYVMSSSNFYQANPSVGYLVDNSGPVLEAFGDNATTLFGSDNNASEYISYPYFTHYENGKYYVYFGFMQNAKGHNSLSDINTRIELLTYNGFNEIQSNYYSKMNENTMIDSIAACTVTYPNIDANYLGYDKDNMLFHGTIHGGISHSNDDSFAGVLSLTANMKDSVAYGVRNKTEKGELNIPIANYLELKNVNYSMNLGGSGSSSPSHISNNIRIDLKDVTKMNPYTFEQYRSSKYFPKYGYSRWNKKDSYNLHSSSIFTINSVFNYTSEVANVYLDYMLDKQNDRYTNNSFPNGTSYGETDLCCMSKGFDFTAYDLYGLKDYLIFYDVKLNLDKLLEDYPDITSIDYIDVKANAYLNYKYNSITKNIVSTRAMIADAYAPYLIKNKKSSDDLTSKFHITAGIENKEQSYVILSDQLSEITEIGNKKYTNDEIQQLLPYFKYGDLSIELKHHTLGNNNSTDSTSGIIAKSVVDDNGNVSIVSVNDKYTVVPMLYEDVKDIPYNNEKGYPITGNLFSVKILKTDGSSFEKNDYFDILYDLSLDIDKTIDGLSFRDLDVYQGGCFDVTNQATIAYQWDGNQEWVAAGASVENVRFLEKNSVAKRLVSTGDNRFSYQIQYFTGTSGKLIKQHLLLHDNLCIDVRGINITDEQKQTLSLLAANYLSVTNKKYYYDNKPISLDSFENGDFVYTEGDLSNVTWDADQKTAVVPLFVLELSKLLYHHTYSFDYDVAFDWTGFTNAVVEQGILTDKDIQDLSLQLCNKAVDADGKLLANASTKQWKYPTNLKASLSKTIKTVDKNTYQWTMDYFAGAKTELNSTISDMLQNPVSEQEYGSDAWEQDMQSYMTKQSCTREKALSIYWVGQLLKEYLVSKGVSADVYYTGKTLTDYVTDKKVGSFVYGRNNSGMNQSLTDDMFTDLTGETILYDSDLTGFTLHVSKMPEASRLRIVYQMVFDDDAYKHGEQMLDFGRKALIASGDTIDMNVKGLLTNRADAHTKDYDLSANASLSRNLALNNHALKKQMIDRENLHTLIYQVDTDLDAITARDQVVLISDKITSEKLAKYVSLTDIGMFLVSGDTKEELQDAYDASIEEWQTIAKKGILYQQNGILNQENYQYTTVSGETGMFTATKSGFVPINGFQNFALQIHGNDAAYQRVVVLYRLAFDFDAYKADGNAMSNNLYLTNTAGLHTNLTTDISSNTNNPVLDKDLVTKQVNYVSYNKDYASWRIDYALGSLYTKEDLINMDNVVITDTLPYGLEYSYLYFYYYYDAQLRYTKSVPSSDYTVVCDGRKVMITLRHPELYVNGYITIYARVKVNMENVQNVADITLNGKKHRVKAKPIAKLYGNMLASGWITSDEKMGVAALVKTDAVTKLPMEGVTFTLYDENQNAIYLVKDEQGYHVMTDNDKNGETEVKTSAAGEIIVSGLAYGTYHFVEKATLDGYLLDDTPQTFTIDDDCFTKMEDGTYQTVVKEISMENKTTQVAIVKENAQTSEPVIGAVLDVYAKEDVDENNQPLKDAKSLYHFETAAEPHVLTSVIPGDYVVVESEVPDGYLQAEPLDIHVKLTDELQTFVMKDEPITVTIEKQDFVTKNLLSGAILRLSDESGKLIREWITSDTDGELFMALPAGTYLLQEITAPDGYTKSEDMTLVVKSVAEKQTFVMEDVHEKVIRITKYDTDGQTLLSGVTFSCQYPDGTVEEKMTDTNGELAFVGYDEGEYVITEVKTVPGHTLLKDPISITLPFLMTKEDAKQQNLDTTKAVWSEQLQKWCVYEVGYSIMNHVTFVLPKTGSSWGVIGFVFAGVIGLEYLVIFISRKRRKRMK